MAANQVTWTSPHGRVIDLTDEQAGFLVTAQGTRGLRSVSYDFVTDQYAGADGVTVRSVRAAANEPTLGLYVRAEDEFELQTRMRRLVHEMLPQAGSGKLTVSTPWGDTRTLECFYTGGLEGDEDTAVTLPGRWFKTILKFLAPDPWWHGPEQKISFGLGAPTNFFPFFPLRLAPSSVQGNFTVSLADTDAVTYPLWTIWGPGSNLVLTNETIDRSIQVNVSLVAGERLVIDSRPGRQSVRRFPVGTEPGVDDGINEMGALQSDPALWALQVGTNKIVAQLTGATTDSRIEGLYTPRYAGF